MIGAYRPFDRLYPFENRRRIPRGDEGLEDMEDDFPWESPLDRLYRTGLWYYFPPPIF